MPLKELPSYKSPNPAILEIPQPGSGGLNLKDLEFEQELNQSPYMKNMMYRNGAFSKRYGQKVYATFDNTIYATTYFDNNIITHTGTKIYKGVGTTKTEIATGIAEQVGLFVTYAQSLYYKVGNKIYQYKYLNNSWTWSELEYYIPEVLINCKPDGSYSDPMDDYNAIGSKFKEVYNADGTSTEYKVYGDEDSVINWDGEIIVEVDGVIKTITTDYTIDKVNKKITFTTAPQQGNLNVIFTFTMDTTKLEPERSEIFSSKYYSTFGGSNNSRLFLAGAGSSKYYFSESYDISYFPINNWGKLGNSESDITGFGKQYNILLIFKPTEIYSIVSYTETSTSTVIEENIGLESFKTQLVNSNIGCDAPYSIQLVNNLLTWFNSREGVCTLVSTSIIDERNVRVISRNINRTNNFDIEGILDINESLENIQSVDFDNKYFLCFPTTGKCFMWDYGISPYSYTTSKETDPKYLDWFLFDRFYVKEFLREGKDLVYVSNFNVGSVDFTKSLIKLNDTFEDLDFNNDGEPDGIASFYMTPFMQFNAVYALKNVKNIFIQCRGDTASVIDIYYYTDGTNGEQDGEPIRIGGKMWPKFEWSTFQWFVVGKAKVFRRKCNLKKIEMASFYFANSEPSRDLSISHLAFEYSIVKNVR